MKKTMDTKGNNNDKDVCYILFLSFRMLASMDGIANLVTSSVYHKSPVRHPHALSARAQTHTILSERDITTCPLQNALDIKKQL
jgi:hypothetical protein